MAKYFGHIGFAQTLETSPGVVEETIVERKYYGDLVRNIRKLQTVDKVNDDVTVANQISVISDPFVSQNFHNIRYAEFMGVNWKVTSVEVQYPRLILTLGGVYNE